MKSKILFDIKNCCVVILRFVLKFEQDGHGLFAEKYRAESAQVFFLSFLFFFFLFLSLSFSSPFLKSSKLQMRADYKKAEEEIVRNEEILSSVIIIFSQGKKKGKKVGEKEERK